MHFHAFVWKRERRRKIVLAAGRFKDKCFVGIIPHGAVDRAARVVADVTIQRGVSRLICRGVRLVCACVGLAQLVVALERADVHVDRTRFGRYDDGSVGLKVGALLGSVLVVQVPRLQPNVVLCILSHRLGQYYRMQQGTLICRTRSPSLARDPRVPRKLGIE